MQTEVLTASVALALVQLCVALIMVGLFFTTPRERCTRHWAVAGLCIAIGILLLIANGGAYRPAVQFTGNALLILGVVFTWSGIRAFFKRPPHGYAGWTVAAVFLVLLAFSLAGHAPVTLLTVSIMARLCLQLLIFFEFWRGQKRQRRFAGWLALSVSGLLIVDHLFTLTVMKIGAVDIHPGNPALRSLMLIYLLPMAGSILMVASLVLLYFERIVADKHHLATHDELTGLLNRRAIVAAGEREIALATRMNLPFAVAFADIDHFKQVNDRLGHDAGDRVIAEVARVLRQACRNVDLVGRYGGEEFCVALPGADAKGAIQIGQRLVEAVRQHRFGDGVSVTISVGVATLDKGDPSWSTLIRRADQALYEAKSRGRDRFVSAACC